MSSLLCLNYTRDSSSMQHTSHTHERQLSTTYTRRRRRFSRTHDHVHTGPWGPDYTWDSYSSHTCKFLARSLFSDAALFSNTYTHERKGVPWGPIYTHEQTHVTSSPKWTAFRALRATHMQLRLTALYTHDQTNIHVVVAKMSGLESAWQTNYFGF